MPFEPRTIARGHADPDAALAHEALVADMHIKAADKTFDPKAETILRLLADRDVGVELGGPAAQGFGDGMGESAFRRRREPKQTRGREALLIGDRLLDGPASACRSCRR